MENSTYSSTLFLFPPISFFHELKKNKSVEVDAYENYQKRSKRNRFEILSANGVHVLTVPLVKGKNQQQRITEVEISYDGKWEKIHLNAIQSAYGKAPFFEHYFSAIEKIYSKKTTHLYAFNMDALTTILKLLKLDVAVCESQEFIQHKSLFEFHPLPYHQVFEDKFGFTADLSILDLLMNCGPASSMYF